jgi:hypothetical protein
LFGNSDNSSSFFGAIPMRPSSLTVSSATTSATYPVDYKQCPFALGIGVVSTGANTYKIQHTFDDIMSGATATWFDNAAGAKTVSSDFNYAFPVTAVRLNVTVYGSGSVTMIVLQGDR